MRFPTATLHVPAIEPGIWTCLVHSKQAAALGLNEVVGECAHGRVDRFPSELKGHVIRKHFAWINQHAIPDTPSVRSSLKVPSDIEATLRAFSDSDLDGEMHACIRSLFVQITSGSNSVNCTLYT